MNKEEMIKMFRIEGDDLVAKRFAGIMHLMVGAIYSVAQSLMVDAVAELRQRNDLWRGRLKYDATRALGCYDKVLRLQKEDLGPIFDVWLDSVDIMDEEMKVHIQKIYWAIDGVLLAKNVKDHALIARCEVVRAIIALGKDCFDSMCRVVHEIDPRNKVKRGEISWFSFDDVMFHWDRLSSALTGNIKGIDLNDNQTCVMALQVVQNKMTDFEYIERNVEKAFESHPEQDPRIGEGIEELKQKYAGGNVKHSVEHASHASTTVREPKRADWEGWRARKWQKAQSAAMISLGTMAGEKEKRGFIDYLDTMGVISHKQRKQLIKAGKEMRI